ncbi:MAG: family 10 glycosylhydrolase [Prevotella sp.]|nr:family 10 glycosylhydrolase [Prevotella sp.]
MWLTTIGGLDWPRTYATNTSTIEMQKAELRQILDDYQRAGINTVLLQARVRATTIYPSQYEPWDGCVSGQPGRAPGYDPLVFAIEECHRRGMELHAWVVTIPIGKWTSYGCSRLRKKYPSMVKKIGVEGYMDPEKSQTATYLADMCQEIVERYDVDGIHLDYIRYPETWKQKVSKSRGRENITAIVRAISNCVKARKPWVKMSCSPIGKYDDLPRYSSRGWNARSVVCQDAVAWMNNNLMDALFPMMYFQGDNFYPFAVDWKQCCGEKIVAPGLGIYFMSPREKNWSLDVITREMAVLRQNGMGHTFFRSRFFTDNLKGIFNFTANEFNVYPALPPAMTWVNGNAPTAPENIVVDTVSMTMSWDKSLPMNDSPNVLYNIYSSNIAPVDITDARNLMLTRIEKNSVRIQIEPRRYYAVTAIDRYGNESKPLQSHKPMGADSETKPLPTGSRMMACDGNVLTLPESNEPIDFSYYVIETMQGNIVKTVSGKTSRLNVAQLPEGMYQVRTIGKKGKNHRLGFFIVKRRKAN